MYKMGRHVWRGGGNDQDARREERREGEKMNLSLFLLDYYSQLTNDVALTHNFMFLII
jgi:hypothetical protein